ncbi:MAG TPA: YetF domain-containing protein [Streptosporangiaceae bacterium]|nr:YetF domain-containing protein [Streptosporangiaceae bacterium]
MPAWLTGDWPHLGAVAAKAALMYLAALIGLRLTYRRTLAQWTAIDFAAAVAIGAIIGRTAIASGQSLLFGVVALATILAAHWVISASRYSAVIAKLTDHRVRVLVEHGRVRDRQLRICGITKGDLFAQLRQQGAYRLEDLRYVLYETKGGLTVVPEDGRDTARQDLVAAGLKDAAGHAGTDGERLQQRQAGQRGRVGNAGEPPDAGSRAAAAGPGS